MDPPTKRGATENAVSQPNIFDLMVQELRDPSIALLGKRVDPWDFYMLYMANYKIYRLADRVGHYDRDVASPAEERARRFVAFCGRIPINDHGQYLDCVWRTLMLRNFPMQHLADAGVLASDDAGADTDALRSDRRRWRLVSCLCAQVMSKTKGREIY